MTVTPGDAARGAGDAHAGGGRTRPKALAAQRSASERSTLGARLRIVLLGENTGHAASVRSADHPGSHAVNRILVCRCARYRAATGSRTTGISCTWAPGRVGGAALTMTVPRRSPRKAGSVPPISGSGAIGTWTASPGSSVRAIAGSAAAIQLAHAGRKGSMSRAMGGSLKAVPPSAGGWPVVGPTAEAFTDVCHARGAFWPAKSRRLSPRLPPRRNARAAGFDVVEVHAATDI